MQGNLSKTKNIHQHYWERPLVLGIKRYVTVEAMAVEKSGIKARHENEMNKKSPV
jgi:hypothetical protein